VPALHQNIPRYQTLNAGQMIQFCFDWSRRDCALDSDQSTDCATTPKSSKPSVLMPTAVDVLTAWLSHRPRHCVDLRSPQSYARGHLVPSTSIPLDKLEGRFAQLPPKREDFAFLLVIDQGARFKGSPVDEVLRSRGWTIRGVIELSGNDEEVWTYARERRVFATGEEGREFLFQPAPILARWIDSIEHEVPDERPVVLDIGCGSGRDLGFLTYRQLQIPTPRMKKWGLIGLDNWAKATERTNEMIDSINPAQPRGVIHAEVIDSTGEFKRLSGDPGFDRMEGRFWMVLMIRFFPRSPAFFPRLGRYMELGGFLLFSHFTSREGEEYESPPAEKRVCPGEVEGWLGGEWEVLQAGYYSVSEDGRPMWDVVAKYKG
jgi:SAM-dependent methyltransferase